MDRKVLQTCVELVIFLVCVALEAVHHRASHHCHQVWILSVGLLAASPPRVTEDVDVRSPYGKAVVLSRPLTSAGRIELDALLCRCHVKHVQKEFIIPAGSHTDSLREYGSEAVAGRAVKSLVPPIVLLDAELRNCRAVIAHKRHLLFKCQTTKKVFCSFFRA